MVAKVEIFNAALTHLGDDRTIDPDDDRDFVRVMDARYAAARDATLRAHPWNFALALASIAVDGTKPLWGFARAFTLPSDPYCLRAYRLQDPLAKWKVRGRKIHTDEAAPLKLEYIARVTDTEQFDADFVETLAARLAWMTAFRITKRRSKEQEAKRTYRDLLAEARSVDGQEGSPEEAESSEFLLSRA